MVPHEPGMGGPVLVGEQAQGRIRVALSGGLELANAQVIGDQLRAVMSRDRPRVLLLDMSAVDFCDCAALQALIDVHGEGERAGTRVVISVASPMMVWLLRLFALDRLFDYPTTGPATGESSG
jgi:anti-anti-sigma factor